ncbi:OLC1v1038983C1 [Oldenlandia corymbosa var. corymbosa]|uniref:OLC1v1038983C1 n=1 Tax=Oldenlandia corymbosa var. corymbosa TaxID=529605 RepID=A0AAV1D1P5_OLDCO|nr:OLC1v1038983C1 [Oldenlandia corymbosa var. corymbosa]
MGGKGRKRREKNYKAAHGGQTGLPPPPDRSALDAVPSKLRKLMSFTGLDGRKGSTNGADKNRVDRGRVDKRSHSEGKEGSKIDRTTKEDENSTVKLSDDYDEEHAESSMHEKKRKKRKRKLISDLRFEQLDELGGTGSKRKERRKQRLEEMKKKRKKTKDVENEDFQARDNVKFGEVVEAPPKLVAVPKAFKTVQGASQERLRLQAIEAYRNRKGWVSRPGVALPPTAIMSQDS